MVSHQEVAKPKGGRTKGVEVRPEVWTELLLEVLGTEGMEVQVQREAEVPLTISPLATNNVQMNLQSWTFVCCWLISLTHTN